MYDQFKLSGAARGFRVSGKKLLPRDASLFQFGKSNAERRRALAAELAHNIKSEREHLASLGQKPSYIDAQVVRFRSALSTRRAKRVEQLFEDVITSDHKDEMIKAACVCLGNAQWRYFDALDNAYHAELARHADDQLLSYARG